MKRVAIAFVLLASCSSDETCHDECVGLKGSALEKCLYRCDPANIEQNEAEAHDG